MVEVTFHNLPHSDAVDAAARQRAARLLKFYRRIIRTHVTVERPQHRHRQGDLFNVRIRLEVPGEDILVGREPAARHAHEDVYVALRDAFHAARRRLEDYARRQRGLVKTHADWPEGRVVRLDPAADCGLIRTPDGHEVYFHRHSVLRQRFGKLHPGSRVRFVEQEGREGPQASCVRVLGRAR